MTTIEFNEKLKELDSHIACLLDMFEKETKVKVYSLAVETDPDGNYHMLTGLEFPEE